MLHRRVDAQRLTTLDVLEIGAGPAPAELPLGTTVVGDAFDHVGHHVGAAVDHNADVMALAGLEQTMIAGLAIVGEIVSQTELDPAALDRLQLETAAILGAVVRQDPTQRRVVQSELEIERDALSIALAAIVGKALIKVGEVRDPGHRHLGLRSLTIRISRKYGA